MQDYDYDTFDLRIQQDTQYIVVSQKRFGIRYYAIYKWNGTRYEQVTAFTKDEYRTLDTCQFLEEQAYKKMSYVVPNRDMNN